MRSWFDTLIPPLPARAYWAIRALGPLWALLWTAGGGWLLVALISLAASSESGEGSGYVPGLELVIPVAAAIVGLATQLALLRRTPDVHTETGLGIRRRVIVARLGGSMRVQLMIAAPLSSLILPGSLLVLLAPLFEHRDASEILIGSASGAGLLVFALVSTIATLRAPWLGAELTADTLIIRGGLRTRRIARDDVESVQSSPANSFLLMLLKLSDRPVLEVRIRGRARLIRVFMTAQSGNTVPRSVRTIKEWLTSVPRIIPSELPQHRVDDKPTFH